MATWTITPIPLYRFVVPGPEVLFQRGFGETIPMVIYAFVLSEGTRTVLVDTGLPDDFAALNTAIRDRKGPAAGFFPIGDTLPGELARRNLAPDLVVVTSFGPYAVGSLPAWKNIPLVASARGLEDLTVPEEPALLHPIPAECAAALAEASPVSGSAELFPGLSFLEVGIHHPASAALLVTTADSVVALPDPVFTARNLTEGLALGAAEFAAGWHGMVRVLGERADAILPIHDPDPRPVPRAAWHATLRPQ